jgi:hypothetical protein
MGGSGAAKGLLARVDSVSKQWAPWLAVFPSDEGHLVHGIPIAPRYEVAGRDADLRAELACAGSLGTAAEFDSFSHVLEDH